MGNLSPEKQQQLAALEAERDASDDDDDDYAWVKLESGNSVRLHGKRLHNYLARNGLDDSDAEGTTQADPLEAGANGVAAKKAAPAKKAAGKKTAAPDEAEAEGDGELEADAEPARRRPVFF